MLHTVEHNHRQTINPDPGRIIKFLGVRLILMEIYMSELLEDATIRDFLFDYSRLKRTKFEYQEALDIINQRLPIYMRRFRSLAHRMTQIELANALEVDHSYISKIENGHMKPSNEFLLNFEKYIRVWNEDA